MRFFLIFNRKLKLFHFVLDETIPIADQLIPIPGSERILIGNAARQGSFQLNDNKTVLELIAEGLPNKAIAARRSGALSWLRTPR